MNSSSKTWSVLLAACAVAVVAGGCSSSSAGPQSYTIAWIPKQSVDSNAVFALGKQGAAVSAAALTSSSGDQVTSLYLGPTGATADDQTNDQIELTQQAIAQHVSAITMSCNDGTKLQPSIDQAVAAGIPVMTWDSDSPSSQRFTYYGIDNKAAGAKAAELLATVMGDTGKIAVFSGNKDAQNLADRVNGFLGEIGTNHTQISNVATVYCPSEVADDCAAVVETTLKANPSINGVFFAGLWALLSFATPNATTGPTAMPTWEALATSGALKTVAFDSLPRELEIMQAKKVQALIGQKYWGWGYTAISMTYGKLAQGKSYQDFTDSDFDVVCPNNVAQMSQMWTDQDFTQVLPDCTLLMN